ncbi:ABC transporter ATP-binding protein [Jannaschia seohaensis]|uniref:Branched-chain amino acid transport system ATP-binding protein n=1 Tax=Jannaschia seohaensis TaxID=475081 RepID=A0A2Y9B5R5_9RHOB|nr:ABC transporter ATP-binding protein [Jannaschia seohaensis]PWJ13824.1 branched-chain amino acid transport system ATP-binding protein [Jannaschia seohaensis]SSA50337.1 branched-chain amino acid transport system ATP-binding protein [Jannaschia seohaensis]
MLKVTDLAVRYGRIHAVQSVSARLEGGEVLLLAGLNGAGKSSFVRAVAGLVPIASGKVELGGRDITGLPLHRLDGVALLPEGRVLAPSLTVGETLKLGGGAAGRAVLRGRKDEVLERLPELAGRLGQRAGTLSGGEATMLALGRALMAGPRLLLLDEPTLGLSPAATERVFEILARLRREGLGMVLVEQNLRRAHALADRVLVLRRGRALHRGPAGETGDAQALEDLVFTDQEEGAL